MVTGFGDGLHDILTVHVIVEDVLPPIPTAHEVVRRPGDIQCGLCAAWG